MDSGDPTAMLLSKIKSLEPEFAPKIIGYLLLRGCEERDLMRLALGPEAVLQSMIVKVKTQLGLPSNNLSAPSTPPSPSPLNPICRPPINGRGGNPNGFMDFCRNSPSSPSSNSSWPLISANPNGSNTHISPKPSHFLSLDGIRSGPISKPSGSHQNNEGPVADAGGDSGTGADLLDEQQLGDYLSFLDDSSSKTEEFIDPRVPLDYSVNVGETHSHRRSFSADACFGFEDDGFDAGFKPCMYYSRGFCKNGESCKFIHAGFPDNVDGNGVMVDSPRKVESFVRQQEEMMRMKMAYQQQRLAAAQFLARVPQLPNEKRIDLLLHQHPHRRVGGALPFGDDRYWSSSPGRLERSELMAMHFSDQSSSASRQIYLTFPADSTFKDEDVANYFSLFGAVQDVRIPYQQKRMFGFVSFVHPETVKLVLARGNPHFICDSRVLVKHYKEKGKVLDRKQQHLIQQQILRGKFSPCSSPSGVDPREQCDFPLGSKMLYDGQEMMRRKMEQVELQRAIELERRRFINLQLPEFKNGIMPHHQRSLSVGSPAYFSSCSNQNSVFSSENPGPEGLEVNGNTHLANAHPYLGQSSGSVYHNNSIAKEGTNDSETVEPGGESTIKLVLPSNLFPCVESAADADDGQTKTDESAETDAKVAVLAATGNNPEPPLSVV
ncbi:PREDICTED: zinc finger CCCH domain-containing protein 55-like [Tarenaya hassleriana]|uniref:zinc finger CCCH domain-containing protein 55-like n=1 Tax=Tarenaya hassleriana TaxID=28532 RepID=UPI00053C2DFD|nr:PREDICTED: zinc finger CCCH domain-containing protein 55-like [Tarenaya hassleriana]